MNAVGECDLCATHPRRITDNWACSAPWACPADDQEAIFGRPGPHRIDADPPPRTRAISGDARITGTASFIRLAGMPCSENACLNAGRLFVPAPRRVAAGRGRVAPPFRERRQPVVLFRYLEQATLILHRIRGQSPGPFRALAPVIRIGQKICH